MPEPTIEQRRVIGHEQGNILVTASAGSGKTHTMIERIKRLVIEKGVGVKEILCVTFTEASATDMKEKLKTALAEKIDEDRTGRIVRQLAEVATADISTIDSFCGKLVRHYFFETEISPDYKVIDSADSKVMMDESLNKVMRSFYKSGDAWFYTLVERYSLKRKDLPFRSLILSLYKFISSEADPIEFLDGVLEKYSDVSKILNIIKADLDSELNGVLTVFKNNLNVLLSTGATKAVAYVSEVIAMLESVVNASSPYVLKDVFDKVPAVSGFGGKDAVVLACKEEISIAKKKITAIKSAYSKIITNEIDDLANFENAGQTVKYLVDVVKAFIKQFSADKREENVLDFGDLEHFALEVLKNDKVREEVKNKYKYVFVDEYQDTNATQEKILEYIANDNVFMVGDIKQSIYGFRGCVPDFFISKSRAMRAKKQAVESLNMNFRSCGAVINAVNQIFDFCMTKEYFGEDYKTTSRLVEGCAYKDDKLGGRFELHFTAPYEKVDKPEKPRVYDILDELKERPVTPTVSAQMIAKIINDEVGKKFYDIKEKGENKEKIITYKDITILSRKRNSASVQELMKDLSSLGIPVASGVSENVCNFPEVITIINLLQIVDNFRQDAPLAVTMLSAIGKFSEEELVEIVRFYKDALPSDRHATFTDTYFYYLNNANGELFERVKKFNDYISALRVSSDFIGAYGVINKVVEDADYESYLLAQKDGKTKIKRLRRFIIASMENGKKLTVYEMLKKVNTSPDAFLYEGSSTEDAVNVCTIHSSKGLEYPVVIVCGMEQDIKSKMESRQEVYTSRKFGFAPYAYDDENRLKKGTLMLSLINKEADEERIKEEMRLLYVAATRAKYSLHLTFVGDKDKRSETFEGATKYLDYIPLSMPMTIHSHDEFQLMAYEKEPRKVLYAKVDEKKVEEIRRSVEYVYPSMADTVLPLKRGVTSAVERLNEEQTPTFVLFDEPSPDIERGNIAHKILELTDFNSLDPLSVQVESMIKNGLLQKEDVEKVNVNRIENAIKIGIASLVKGAKLYREKPFLVGIEGNRVLDTESTAQVLLQGVIDLLAISGDDAYIIDYKYSAKDSASLKATYHKQLELYSYAVEKVLGKKVKERVLVNLFTGDVVKV